MNIKFWAELFKYVTNTKAYASFFLSRGADLQYLTLFVKHNKGLLTSLRLKKRSDRLIHTCTI